MPNKSLATDACSAGCACSTNAAQLRRWAAARRTTENMASKYQLRQIASRDPDPDVRIAAIQKLDSNKDKYELEQIAEHGRDPRVRLAAVQKLQRD